MRRFIPMIVLGLTLPCFGQDPAAPRAQGVLGDGVPKFSVRPGYRVTLAAQDLKEARFLTFDDGGTLYVSQPSAGNILALRDTDEDGSFEYVAPYVTDRPKVQAMQFRDGWLWFATSRGIFRARDPDNDGASDEVVDVIPEGSLPGDTGHWFRSLLVTDDAVYTSVGDSANVSDETATERQKIWRFDHEGRGKTVFATGVRNTEELQLRPGTDEVWGADHGSDQFGAHLGETDKLLPVTSLYPPEEFNRYVEGGFYGHPFVVGHGLPRPEYAKRKDILELAAKAIPPEWALGAHWAPNGWTFVTKDAMPGHKGDAVVACHGSWNAQRKAGYKLQRILFDAWTGRPYGSQTIVDALADDGETVLARPCDVAEAPDGALFFTCDQTHRVYRLSHEKIDENQGH
jgi:glucose/arabinose dehydrogenase